MARLLAETANRLDPRANPFANGERLKLIRSVAAPEGDPQQLAVYGQESVLAGESAAAVEAFERLRKMMTEGTARLEAGPSRTVTEMTALAYLRLGEQENCVDDHNIDRCLLPIRDAGVHTRKRGSRGAIRIYQELLAQDPGNGDYRWLLLPRPPGRRRGRPPRAPPLPARRRRVESPASLRPAPANKDWGPRSRHANSG